MKKYDCHITNMRHSHYAKWVYGPNIFDTSTKTQPTAIFTMHVIAMYVPVPCMPIKCHIHAKFAN